MTVTPLPAAGQTGAARPVHLAGLSDSRRYASRACTAVHEATAPLFAALENAVDTAAAQGISDTAARTAAAALRDARIALELATIAAGRALADREVHLRVGPATAAPGAGDATMIAS